MFNVLSGQHRLKLMLNIGCPVLARELITGKNVVIMPEPLPPQEPKIGWVKEKPIEAPGFEPKNNNRNKRRRHQRRRNYHPQNG